VVAVTDGWGWRPTRSGKHVDRDPLLTCASPTVPVADLSCLARRKLSCGPASSSVRGPCRGGWQQSPADGVENSSATRPGCACFCGPAVDEFTLEFIDDAAE
jgi:hypothetical protein